MVLAKNAKVRSTRKKMVSRQNAKNGKCLVFLRVRRQDFTRRSKIGRRWSVRTQTMDIPIDTGFEVCWDIICTVSNWSWTGLGLELDWAWTGEVSPEHRVMVGSFPGYHQDIIYFDTRRRGLRCRGVLELPPAEKRKV
jgi:hypothetical protein